MTRAGPTDLRTRISGWYHEHRRATSAAILAAVVVTPELIRADATEPIFLNATQPWFKLAPQGGCITEENPQRVYDLHDRVELPTIIDQVLAVWPATSSQSR